MELLKLVETLSKAIEKSDIAKGCLIGGATVLGTGGAVYIGKKLLENKLSSKEKHNLNITVD